MECIVQEEGVVYEEREHKEYSLSIHILKSFEQFPEIETVAAKGRSVILCMPSNTALLHHFSSCSQKD